MVKQVSRTSNEFVDGASCSIINHIICPHALSLPPEENLDLEDGQWEEIHVITGALKLFLRELPEPLFPYSFFDKFIAAISKSRPGPNKTLYMHLNSQTQMT